MRERVIPWLNLTSGVMPAPSLLAAKIGTRHFWLGLVCCCGPGPGYPPALAAPNIWKSTVTSHFEGLSINVTTFSKCWKEHQLKSSINLAFKVASLLMNCWRRKNYLKRKNILISTKFIFLTLLRQAIKACGHKTRETIKDPLKPYKKFRVLEKVCCSTFYVKTFVQKLIKSQLFKFCVLKIVFPIPASKCATVGKVSQ